VISPLVQEILVALIVGSAFVFLLSRFVIHRRVRKCPACGPDPRSCRPGRTGIRAKGLDVLP
jgi:hypothetical protein